MTRNGMKPNVLTTVILVMFAFSGAAALIYEVAWVRALSNVLGSATYAVSTMLAAFMGGLALGGYIGGEAGSRSKKPVLLFGIIQAGIGVFGLLTIPAIDSLSPLYFLIYNKFHLSPDIFYVLQFVVCFVIMAVPTVLMGASFPLVARIVSGEQKNISVTVGRVYSMNTLGALVGSFSAGFILIPTLGLKGTVQLAAGINVVVALFAIMGSNSLRKVFYSGMGIFLFTIASLVAMKSEARLFPYNYFIANKYKDFVQFTYNAADFTRLFHKDDPHGTVNVYFSKKENFLLLQNGGRLEAATGSDMEHLLFLSYLPISAKPEAKSFLGIGMGSGISMKAAKSLIDDVTWVEINPSVVKAASEYFYPNMLKSGVNVVIDDARSFLQGSDKKFDIITSHPSYPVDQGSSALFTREFFKIAASRLNPGGVMCQWFPYQLYSGESTKIIIKTFNDSFPHMSVWKTSLTGDLFLLGSKEPFEEGVDKISRNIYKMSELPTAIIFKVWKWQHEVDLLIANASYLPYNTDDKPLLEFLGARAFLVPVERSVALRDRYLFEE